VLILLFAIVLVGSARVDGGDDPPAASAAGRGRSASRGIDVRVPKMSQPRNGIPVHEISGRGHDVALERHREPDAGAQSPVPWCPSCFCRSPGWRGCRPPRRLRSSRSSSLSSSSLSFCPGLEFSPPPMAAAEHSRSAVTAYNMSLAERSDL